MVVKSKQSSTVPLSIRASRDAASKLDELAAATDRSKSWHIEQALKQYLDTQLWQIRDIEQGLEDFRKGRIVPHDQIADRVRARWAKKKSARKK